jgi:hypothetical protein
MCIYDAPYEEDIGLFYNLDDNIFTDEDGFEVVDIFSIIHPNFVYLFKTKKEDMVVYGVDGQIVELFYPDPEDKIYS